jgi:hypothetical protein
MQGRIALNRDRFYDIFRITLFCLQKVQDEVPILKSLFNNFY